MRRVSELPPGLDLERGEMRFGLVEPLPCDKWIASSVLQKAIRRGDVVTAQRALMTCLQAGVSTLWRRMLVIAFEDVGIGSIDALSEIAALASKRRESGDNQEQDLLYACQVLAEAQKDRSTDLLFAAAQHSAELDEARDVCGSIPVATRLQRAADTSLPLAERCVAAWYASGVEAWPERRVGQGDFDGMMQTFAHLGVPNSILDLVRIGVKKTREPITLFLPLLWLASEQDAAQGQLPLPVVEPWLPKMTLVCGVPTYGLDGHTRMGKEAIFQFGKHNQAIASLLNDQLPDFRVERALRLAVFYADSAAIRPRLMWGQSKVIETLGIDADFLSAKVSPEVGNQLTQLVRDHLGHLNQIRSDLILKAQAETR